VARFGSLDILVNNAGLNHRGSITQHTPQALADVVTINLTAPIYLTRAAIDHMPRGGAIVNVASLAGFVPFGGWRPYCASKAGLRAFARAARRRSADRGITVSTVSPAPSTPASSATWPRCPTWCSRSRCAAPSRSPTRCSTASARARRRSPSRRSREAGDARLRLPQARRRACGR
jgi:NAD(P)-dependent dehydrogenase (short-subunit alcohol dehydrogenase family)